MSGEQLSPNQEVIKTAIGYIVPVILATLVSIVGPAADFAWSEVIRTWRGLVVLATLLAAFFINPKFSVWIALVVFLLFLAKRLLVYRVGPKFEKTGFVPILFSGFYHTNASGKFRRSGHSIITETKFIKTLNQLLNDHRIQEAIPLRIVPFKPPRIVHSRYNYEGFESLMRRYASTTLAVMWGVIDDQGRIRNFEVTSSEEHYFGGEKALRTNADVARACQLDQVHTDAVVDFLASAYAALWGHSFCEVLNLQGRWQVSYLVAGNSRRLFQQALTQLRQSAAESGSSILDFERKQVLPLFVTQEAIGLLKGKEWQAAIEKLIDALKINPLWPCYDSGEFGEFYTHRYVWEVSTRDEERLTEETKALFKDTSARSSSRAWLNIPPNLQYLIQWLYDAPDSFADLAENIERWFTDLSAIHPDNSFILLYWAEALKIPHRLRTNQSEPRGTLPLEILDKAIEKCEQALDLNPALPVISVRLSGLYSSSCVYFDERDPEFKRRVDRLRHLLNESKLFFTETLPPGSPAATGTAK